MIKGLKKKFPDRTIGYSDHTLPDKKMSSMTLAYLLGAMIIEKHFTHNKGLPGNDHYHAMDCKLSTIRSGLDPKWPKTCKLHIAGLGSRL